MNTKQLGSVLLLAIALLGAAMSLEARNGGGRGWGGGWRGGGWGGRGWGGGWGGGLYGYNWPGYYNYGWPYGGCFSGACAAAPRRTVIVRQAARSQDPAQLAKLEKQIDELTQTMQAHNEQLESLKTHIKRTKTGKKRTLLERAARTPAEIALTA